MLDTCVLLAAIRSDSGASKTVLRAALESRFQFLISTPLVLEYEAVMTRPEHLKSSGLSYLEIERLVDLICEVGHAVRKKTNIRPQLHDPDDEMVLETAVAGGADAIVTFNRAHFAGVCEGFGIEVISPQEVIRRMKSV